jgi:hypothetical protein
MCTEPLTLTLQPGEHWPGIDSNAVPDDLPPGTLQVALPLYPGAAPTTEQEQRPGFTVPGDPYLKSASATFEVAATMTQARTWYRAAFAVCGDAAPDTFGRGGNAGQPPVDYFIGYTHHDGRNTIYISLSFATAKDGGTLVLYVAVALTPPAYPVAGSILRVPGKPVSVRITRYNGINPGPHESRPVRTVNVTDVAVSADLADEINHLPKVTGRYFCPWDDYSHITLVFTDADGSQHVVRIDLRGCEFVHAPPAPNGRLFDDPHLLPRVLGLLTSAGSRAVALPFDARTLKPVSVRRLGGTPSRFLSTGGNGTDLLYLSGGDLFIESATGGSPRLLVRGIADAGFATSDSYVLARPRSSGNLSHLLLIDTGTGTSIRFALPRQASLLGRVAGAGVPGLSDALQCFPQYVFYRKGRAFAGVDPEHPGNDRFSYDGALPEPSPGELVASGCSGSVAAIFRPGHGLKVTHPVGSPAGDAGHVVFRLLIDHVSFLSWAPDEEHLAYRVGGTLSILDSRNGRSRVLLHLGSSTIRGAAWDPWSRVLALSVSPPGEPASRARVLLADIDGKGTRYLPLPFTGASRLEWSVWQGTALGITRVTPHGTQAWVATLPSLPPDPGASLTGQ